jgi:alkyl sulfatase BDS1-like metallo-beta-lactamase superfamily hydrolase
MAPPIEPSFDDKTDFEDAARGFIGRLEPCIIKNSKGRVVWDNDKYNFLNGASCPETVNPKLWRQAQLLVTQGLFQVTDGIYQVRGFDISNMTLVEGDQGVIVIDPLISVECAEAALKLYRTHRGPRAVTGMIYSHSHVDHFGGSRGVLPEEDSTVPVIAPEGFLEHAVSENIYTGNAMLRRAVFMYGARLSKGPAGQVSCGGAMTNSSGTISLIPPTVLVTRTGQEETVDGVHIIFQITPGAEAPAEANFHFPQRRALCIAENANRTLHNILTLRGAVVRDARTWSRYLDEAIVLFTPTAEVVFGSHGWPTWGHDNILQYLSQQRDMYGYLHDQTLRMINRGMTGLEIAEDFVLPSVLQKSWHTQGFYGSVSNNVKAIYQRYMGWFDGNPAHLWEHPPVQAAQRYVSCMGGIDEVVKKAQAYAEEGDLRFATTLLNHAVFADSEHTGAQHALASVYDRLGYGAENGPWRNFYLTGAEELRHGPLESQPDFGNVGMMMALSVEQLLDSIAIRLDGPRAQTESFTIDLHVTDLKERYWVILSNGVLVQRKVTSETGAGATSSFGCELTHMQLLQLVGRKSVPEGVRQWGEANIIEKLFSLLEEPTPAFNIIKP